MKTSTAVIVTIGTGIVMTLGGFYGAHAYGAALSDTPLPHCPEGQQAQLIADMSDNPVWVCVGEDSATPNIPNENVKEFPIGHLPVTCQEDMPCWDCTTMGNLICGPDIPDIQLPTLPFDTNQSNEILEKVLTLVPFPERVITFEGTNSEHLEHNKRIKTML